MPRAKLSSTDVRSAELSPSRLSGRGLPCAELSAAQLSSSWLSRIKLLGTRLSDASLWGTAGADPTRSIAAPEFIWRLVIALAKGFEQHHRP
ncbi:MAG: pentapeptide repeat-containing protein [Planctomycetota bacterium]